MLVKICGITRPQDALTAAENGADFIGLVFTPTSPRFITFNKAKEVICAIQGSQTKAVGVFTSTSFDEIERVVAGLKLDCVQVYTSFNRQFSCEVLQAVVHSAPISNRNSTYLIENEIPGSGVSFNWTSFIPPKGFSWILSGGLNPENVRSAIDTLSPLGLDVSSGIEGKTKGIKDPYLIKKFIEEAKR